jgi:hypothetical protein
MLYKAIELPSEDFVQFVGVYVLRWGKEDQPSIAFRQATPEEITEEFNRIKDDQVD